MGDLTPRQRQELVDDFTAERGPAVLVAQIEAGGVGLNIQAASVVVLTEPQRKPTTEEQAIARAHRLGQTRRVHVHRLLARDCFDERMIEVLDHTPTSACR
jgi:SNF2 family DNA or RNA helicase